MGELWSLDTDILERYKILNKNLQSEIEELKNLLNEKENLSKNSSYEFSHQDIIEKKKHSFSKSSIKINEGNKKK